MGLHVLEKKQCAAVMTHSLLIRAPLQTGTPNRNEEEPSMNHRDNKNGNGQNSQLVWTKIFEESKDLNKLRCHTLVLTVPEDMNLPGPYTTCRLVTTYISRSWFSDADTAFTGIWKKKRKLAAVVRVLVELFKRTNELLVNVIYCNQDHTIIDFKWTIN